MAREEGGLSLLSAPPLLVDEVVDWASVSGLDFLPARVAVVVVVVAVGEEDEAWWARLAAMAVGERRPIPCERLMELIWEEYALGQGRL